MSDRYFSTKIGTLGGAVAAVFPSIDANSLITSAVLAVIGATISFLVSLLLKIFLKERIRNKLLKRRTRSLSRKRKQ
jgi:ABC-type phosphate transport system permease subunit